MIRAALATALAVTLVLGWAAPPARAAPPAGELAFVRDAGDGPQIWVIRADGAEARRLTRGPQWSRAPAWSPDGARVAFVRGRDAGAQVYVVNADGSRLRRLTGPPHAHDSPSWSPDGRQVLCVRREAGRALVVAIAADGGRERVLGVGFAAAWSPRGDRLAYLAAGEGGMPDLVVADADGARAHRIRVATTGTVPGVTAFAWAPDGRRLAVVTRASLAQDEIRIVAWDGSAERRLTTGRAPAWSPDGRSIAFTVTHAGDAELYVIASERGRARRLTDRRWVSVRPAWSPDGGAVAFLSVRAAPNALYVVGADGRGERRLAPAYSDFSMLPLLAWRPR